MLKNDRIQFAQNLGAGVTPLGDEITYRWDNAHSQLTLTINLQANTADISCSPIADMFEYESNNQPTSFNLTSGGIYDLRAYETEYMGYAEKKISLKVNMINNSSLMSPAKIFITYNPWFSLSING